MRVFESGYWTAANVRGVPIRFHWTVPIACLAFGRFRFAPALWIGILLIILVHEIGHAAFVKLRKKTVLAIEMNALGGLCKWQGGQFRDRVIVAWGGIVAQSIVILLPALLARSFSPTIHTQVARHFFHAFINANLMIIAINLIPIPGLDGFDAWQIFSGRFWRDNASSRKKANKLKIERQSHKPTRRKDGPNAQDIAENALRSSEDRKKDET